MMQSDVFFSNGDFQLNVSNICPDNLFKVQASELPPREARAGGVHSAESQP